MHELALAHAVIATALDAADERGLQRLRLIDVQVGELQRISPETFELCLQEVVPSDEPRLASATITLAIERARFRCRPCGRAFGLGETGEPADGDRAEAIHFVPELAHAFLACPACASPDFEITAGRGVSIERLEGD